jgi:hypothetical protein
MQVGHPEVESETTLHPLDGSGVSCVGSLKPVGELEAVPTVSPERSIEDPHLGSLPAPEVAMR